MKNIKLKTHVILISENFQKSHPRSGEKTHFTRQILSGKKKHTIRDNFDWWSKKIDEVKVGTAILSIRKWSGQPYKSKQIEIKQITSEDQPGYQRLRYKPDADFAMADTHRAYLPELSSNDGLSEEDFKSWFPDEVTNGIIIHFTPFRYVGDYDL